MNFKNWHKIVAKTYEEKAMQRALLQYYNPKNRDIIEKALVKAGRYDLIGMGTKCLIKPGVKSQKTPFDNRRKTNDRNKNYGKKKKR